MRVFDLRPAALGVLIALSSLVAPGLSRAQTPPPTCASAIKGRVVSFDAKTRRVTVDRDRDRGSRRDVLPVAESVAGRARDLKPGDQVQLEMDCSVKPPQVVGLTMAARATPTPGGPRATPAPDARLTTVLISSPEACALSVDFKPWGPLKAGTPAELKLGTGERHLKATTTDGRAWEKVIKVGSDQMIVQVELGPPVATLAEYDTQAAKVHGALQALKTAGSALGEILKKNNFKFEKADAVAIVAAAGTWTRELAVLKAMAAPAERAQVTTDLAALDKHVLEYASLLQKALETAQKNYSVLGEAATYRDRAAAILPLLTPPPR